MELTWKIRITLFSRVFQKKKYINNKKIVIKLNIKCDEKWIFLWSNYNYYIKWWFFASFFSVRRGGGMFAKVKIKKKLERIRGKKKFMTTGVALKSIKFVLMRRYPRFVFFFEHIVVKVCGFTWTLNCLVQKDKLENFWENLANFLRKGI